ncbi:LOW QUALITY PROTEIN: doublecortin domain-containing protein 2C [Perognathus longimembris pacificus]|uniref:LOW QUALITY PROTEIN: doublecortin domain-containing protein 2C n=1 Tax=Perognathus longimembris pacificus TaxID=214514 RepID=UPI0020199261|nr:LOW QUALITY PROTEIN: doublecortin domain-containing protein 2C [Perognathus longimembris pacificus]
MGTRGPYALVDTTPAKTILVYRNGDQFYVGRKFVFSRRRVANFEALLEQLTEQVEVPFGVRRLYTPSRGRVVRELEALQTGGKYVAAGRERFKKLDYIHIVPRKPAKMRKLKEIKPVVHCDLNVPSRWQTYQRVSRHINVFTNGRFFIPPVKVIIPKFSLSDWNCVLATVGDKVFPLGGVRKLYTLTGHLLGSSQDLQDNQFYVAAGLEPFRAFAYWRSPRVPSEVSSEYMDVEKFPPRKKKVDAKGKELPQSDKAPPKTQESVYYAKEGKKKQTLAEPLVESGAEGDVYKARTPTQDTQGALDVREDPEVKVEMPVDQVPAEMVKEEEEARGEPPAAEDTKVGAAFPEASDAVFAIRFRCSSQTGRHERRGAAGCVRGGPRCPASAAAVPAAATSSPPSPQALPEQIRAPSGGRRSPGVFRESSPHPVPTRALSSASRARGHGLR